MGVVSSVGFGILFCLIFVLWKFEIVLKRKIEEDKKYSRYKEKDKRSFSQKRINP